MPSASARGPSDHFNDTQKGRFILGKLKNGAEEMKWRAERITPRLAALRSLQIIVCKSFMFWFK